MQGLRAKLYTRKELSILRKLVMGKGHPFRTYYHYDYKGGVNDTDSDRKNNELRDRGTPLTTIKRSCVEFHATLSTSQVLELLSNGCCGD